MCGQSRIQAQRKQIESLDFCLGYTLQGIRFQSVGTYIATLKNLGLI